VKLLEAQWPNLHLGKEWKVLSLRHLHLKMSSTWLICFLHPSRLFFYHTLYWYAPEEFLYLALSPAPCLHLQIQHCPAVDISAGEDICPENDVYALCLQHRWKKLKPLFANTYLVYVMIMIRNNLLHNQFLCIFCGPNLNASPTSSFVCSGNKIWKEQCILCAIIMILPQKLNRGKMLESAWKNHHCWQKTLQFKQTIGCLWWKSFVTHCCIPTWSLWWNAQSYWKW